MATYQVTYKIKVISEQAQQSIRAFEETTRRLQNIQKPFQKLNTAITNLNNRLNSLTKKAPTIQIKTSEAERKIGRLIGKLRQLRHECQASGLTVGTWAAGSSRSAFDGRRNTGFGNVSRSSRSQAALMTRNNFVSRHIPSNLGYKVIGPTPLDVGGYGAVDFLKGMGIAYGIAGIGSLVNNIVNDSAEYDNTMQTVKNILGSHDKRANFGGRFAQMEAIVRDVGIRTKFTAPEVADAAKFLAMAGFQLEDINASIRPIADIALIGDTALGETADVVTNIMTGYGIAPGKVREAADIMTNTFTMSNTTLMEMAEAYKYSASLLSAGGIEFEESAAALGVLGNAGIKGSQAGTTMRTIMANIVNPTKKQLGAWADVGVKRTDSQGNIRDLVDIFGDLAAQNLSVRDFYRLFHKTAAQGAVSLANHVDDWNNIIKENFLSEGMSQELADAKKNTIKGLWAQLTSALTDDGIKAFEGVQGSIRNMLVEGTEWLLKEDTQNAIKEFAGDVMDLVMSIVSATSRMIKFIAPFKDFIKGWFTFQLYMMPVLTGIRTFKAALLGLGGIVKVTGWIAGLAGQVSYLTMAFKSAIAKAGGFWGALKMGGNYVANNIGSYYQGSFLNGYRNVDPKVWERWERINRVKSKFVPEGQSAASPVPAGAPVPVGPRGNASSNNKGGARPGALSSFSGAGMLKMMGGMAAGAYAGGQVGEFFGGESGSYWGMTAGGLIGSIAPLFLSNPWGWAAIAGVALGGLYMSYRNCEKQIESTKEAHLSFVQSLTMTNGVLTNGSLTATEKYLNVIYNKQLSLNEVIAKRLEMLKEEMGLSEMGKADDKDGGGDGNVLKQAIQDLRNGDSWFSSEAMAWRAADMARGHNFDSSKKFDVLDPWAYRTNDFLAKYNTNDQRWRWRDVNGDWHTLSDPSGFFKNDKDVLAAMSALYAEGLGGSESEKAKAEFQNKLAHTLRHHGTIDDIMGIQADWNSRYGRFKYAPSTHPDNFEYDLDDIEKWDNFRRKNSYTYGQGLYESMVGVYGPNAPVWNYAQTYFKNLDSKALTEQNVVDFVSHMDKQIGYLFKLYDTDYEQFAKNLGFWDGTFHEMAGNPADVVAKGVVKQIDEFFKILKQLDPAASTATSQLTSFFTSLRMAAAGFAFQADGGVLPAVDQVADGTIKKTKDGGSYKYDKNSDQWYPVDNKGKIIGGGLPFKNQQFQAALMAQATDDNNDNNKNGGGYVGSDQSHYKSHYNSRTAAPKQVIVKIDKLLSVERVDLSRPENAEAVANIKAQLAQALVDVVHDFDETWHG